MAKRTIRITVETHSLTLLRTRAHVPIMRCAACGAGTRAITVEQAAAICVVAQRTIFRLVETGRLHFHEMPAGELLICAESLFRLAEETTEETP